MRILPLLIGIICLGAAYFAYSHAGHILAAISFTTTGFLWIYGAYLGRHSDY
jgi:hypothetical protein